MTWFKLPLTKRKWLSSKTFELTFARPPKFSYVSGQRLRLAHDNAVRDYSLVSAPQNPDLAICVRHIASGTLTPFLADLNIASHVSAAGPYGYFNWYASSNPAIFAATGTGIAPFVSLVRSGVRPYRLLHGVRSTTELYYRRELVNQVGRYVPCISTLTPRHSADESLYAGRVTAYLNHGLNKGRYDFYLCGRGDMIREVTQIVDHRFPGSKVFSERFY